MDTEDLTNEEKEKLKEIITSCENYFSNRFPSCEVNLIQYFRNLTFHIAVVHNDKQNDYIIKSFVTTENNKNIFSKELLTIIFQKSIALFTLFKHLKIDIFPQMITFNKDLQFIVMEKIQGTSLDEYLLSEENNNIEEKLLSYASKIAELHGKTLGKEVFEKYVELFQKFGYEKKKKEIYWTRGSEESVYILKERLIANEILLAEPFYEQLCDIFRSVHSSDYLSIIHSDLCPDNIIFSDKKLYFIDIDTVDYYYFFIDVTFFEILFPTCWCVGTIPSDIQNKMRNRYLEVINRYIHMDIDTYNLNAFLGAVMVETTSLVSYFTEYKGSKSIETNMMWGIDTIRNRIQTRFELINNLGANVQGFEDIKEGLKQLKTEIDKRFGKSEGLKPYPAFKITK